MDWNWLRQHFPDAQAAWARRGWGVDPAHFLALDTARRETLAHLEGLRQQRKAVSKVIGTKLQGGRDAEAEQIQAQALNAAIVEAEAAHAQAAQALEDWGLRQPNLPAAIVPNGADAAANVCIQQGGPPPRPGPAPSHVEIAGRRLDAGAGAVLSGSRFTVLEGELARLHRVLGQFMVELHTRQHGYTELNVPVLVRSEALVGTGQLPKFEEDLFAVGEGASRRFLVPTSEVPLTNRVREQILDPGILPLRWTALSLCFRAEAGAAGRDTQGLIRQHQFEKVELVSIVAPEDSARELERMTQAAEAVLEALELPWRRMLLCAGDMGFSAQQTYDLEVWLPSQNAWREISSCSNCGDFQARRMQARYRPTPGAKPAFVHTLNGSGVAVGRALVAVLEHHQRPDGTVRLPSVLRPYWERAGGWVPGGLLVP